MAEIERVRERERPPLKDNPYERVMAQRKALAERNLTGPVVIDCTQQEWFQARQGKLKFFLDPVSFKNTPLQQWRVFIHDIKTKSGKHRHQGGLVIYVLEGKGYSIVEGERKDWEKGDLVLLPMKPGGVEQQHFNTDPNSPAKFVAVEPNWLEGVSVDRGCGFEQLEDAPEYRPGAPTASSCSTSTPIRTSRRSSSPPSRTGSKASL